MPGAAEAFALVVAAVAAGAVSPGPSVLFTVRTALAAPGRAWATALGMAAGAGVFAALALAGLATALAHVPSLHLALRCAGGAYLLLLAWHAWTGAWVPVAPDAGAPPASPGSAFAAAAAVQMSNPKTAVVYASVFATLMPAAPPAWFQAALVPAVVLVEGTWYLAVGLLAGRPAPRRAYLAGKAWADRAAAIAFAGLGLQLVLRRDAAA